MYSMNYYGYVSNDYLCHYGVKGMKWYQHVMAKARTASSRIKSGAKTAGNWAYDHRKQILLTSVAVLATAAAAPYVAIGAQAMASSISNSVNTSANVVTGIVNLAIETPAGMKAIANGDLSVVNKMGTKIVDLYDRTHPKEYTDKMMNISEKIADSVFSDKMMNMSEKIF